MEAFFISVGVVALAEIGDKTQLLAFVLASRFKQPLPIILGIFFATLINHSFAGALGLWITTLINPEVLRWILSASFLAMALWMLIPDSIDDDKTHFGKNLGVFGATFLTFFLAEMGDKTQIATIALTAHYAAPLTVIAGTTLGMLLADVPAVFFGNKLADKISVKWVHWCSAFIFLVMAVLNFIFKPQLG